MKWAVEVANLAVERGEVEVVTDLNMAIEEGETLALVGPNGAGRPRRWRRSQACSHQAAAK